MERGGEGREPVAVALSAESGMVTFGVIVQEYKHY